jgi:hypothetical protein
MLQKEIIALRDRSARMNNLTEILRLIATDILRAVLELGRLERCWGRSGCSER